MENILDNFDSYTSTGLEEVQTNLEDSSSDDEYYDALADLHKIVKEKIFNGDETEYVTKKVINGQITYSGRFSRGNKYFKVHGEDSLLTYNRNSFVATIQITDYNKLKFSKPFRTVKRNFLNMVKIIEILKDELLMQRDEAYRNFNKFLLNRGRKITEHYELAEDFLQLSLILEKYHKLKQTFPVASLLSNIITNKYISNEFKYVTRQLFTVEYSLLIRNKSFPKSDVPVQLSLKKVLEELQKNYETGIMLHREYISNKFSIFNSQMIPLIDSNLKNLSNQQILYINNEDINLLSDLINTLNKELFTEFFHTILDSLLKKLKNITDHISLKEFTPLTHSIYFNLCKGFQELIHEINNKTGITTGDLLKNEQGKWKLAKTINWPSSSLLNKCLERQYRSIFNLMQHFAPGNYSHKRKFDFNFKLFKNINNETFLKRLKYFITDTSNLPTLPEDRLVWIYILDDAVDKLLSENLKLFEPFLNSFVNFIENSETGRYESFRIATHNTLSFIAQTDYYLSRSVIDQNILAKQREMMDKISFYDFKILIEVFNNYSMNRDIIETILSKFPYGPFKDAMEKINRKLLIILLLALSKRAQQHTLITFFRSYNEFLEDVKAVEFNWYIKEINISFHLLCLGHGSEIVKLINENKKSYLVLDPENFIKQHQNNIPRHYVIEIIDSLLNSVISLLEQNKWSSDDNLNATSELLTAIRKSFLYLKEQPDYISFDTFKEESTVPFDCVIANSSCYEDFKQRITIVGESYWYLRKQDEIDLATALELCKKLNNFNYTEIEIIISCYKKYQKAFDDYVGNTLNKTHDDKIKFIVDAVQNQLTPMKVSKWEAKFKHDTVPCLLAGLAAVWSIQASRDIYRIGKSLKPHCIQILCILRLLDVDNKSLGINKHLAQVLTGQGKSLILGLLSSLLALMGHNVRIVCYSEYLASRDQQDFQEFFRRFHINDNISYSTFDDMAKETLTVEVNDRKLAFDHLLHDHILNHNTETSRQIKHKDVSNSILLIDEVDVFFTGEFYGNTYGACALIYMKALVCIQEKIWKLVENKYYNINMILLEVESLIRNEIMKENEEFKTFNEFRFKSGKYWLLTDIDNVIVRKEYTNRSLYEEHLALMIDNAISVATGNNKNWYINRYKINDDGFICYRRNIGLYSTDICDYYNVFNYFRLKKLDYDSKDYANYGYLLVDCGRISYAKLPEKYPLILGVSGTLTSLNEHENRAIKESYNIKKMSNMPSYFGCTNLKFDERRDFTCHNSEEEWLNKIFNTVNSKINARRAVLIFFDTDIEIDMFKEKFFGKFDRLHILTENTEEQMKKKYIDEAGIAKTITLSTRGMGRGVDYKTSVVVERMGGVHVIQTFFSLDVKEETQIKGRTARKDNKGSYELIVCKQHLISDELLTEPVENLINYESVNKAREVRIKEIGNNIETRIITSENDHKTTIEYFESFFKFTR